MKEAKVSQTQVTGRLAVLISVGYRCQNVAVHFMTRTDNSDPFWQKSESAIQPPTASTKRPHLPDWVCILQILSTLLPPKETSTATSTSRMYF